MASMRRIGADVQAPCFLAAVGAAPLTETVPEQATVAEINATETLQPPALTAAQAAPCAPPAGRGAHTATTPVPSTPAASALPEGTASPKLTSSDLMNPALLYCGPVSAVQTPAEESFPERVKHLVTVTEAAIGNLPKL